MTLDSHARFCISAAVPAPPPPPSVALFLPPSLSLRDSLRSTGSRVFVSCYSMCARNSTIPPFQIACFLAQKRRARTHTHAQRAGLLKKQKGCFFPHLTYWHVCILMSAGMRVHALDINEHDGYCTKTHITSPTQQQRPFVVPFDNPNINDQDFY